MLGLNHDVFSLDCGGELNPNRMTKGSRVGKKKARRFSVPYLLRYKCQTKRINSDDEGKQ